MHLGGGRQDGVASFSLFQTLKSLKNMVLARCCDALLGTATQRILLLMLFASLAAMVGKNVKEATIRAGEKVLSNRVCTFDGRGLHI